MLTRVTSEFQITSCQCNKDKKSSIMQPWVKTPKYSAISFLVILSLLFMSFSSSSLMKESWVPSTSLSTKQISRQQGFIKNAYLTIFQLSCFLDPFLSTIPLSWSDATILETVLLDIPILSLASDNDMLGLERRMPSKVSSLSVRLSFFNVPFNVSFNVPWFFMTFIPNFFIVLLNNDSLIFREFFNTIKREMFPN